NRIPIVVTVYDQISITGSITDVDCSTGTGSIDITVSGGSGNYTFDWSNDGDEDPDNDTEDLIDVAAGSYTVTVSDANSSCTATETFILSVGDTTAPTITAPADFSTEGCDASSVTNGTTTLPYSTTIVTITEGDFTAEGGTFTEDNVASITYVDVANGSCPITITRTFPITDDCGQNESDTQTITITTPSFTISEVDGSQTVECLSAATETFTMPTITDGCGNELAPSIATVTDSPDPITCEGTRTYTYTYTDCN